MLEEEEDHTLFHAQTQVLAQALKIQAAFRWRELDCQEESDLIQSQRELRQAMTKLRKKCQSQPNCIYCNYLG